MEDNVINFCKSTSLDISSKNIDPFIARKCSCIQSSQLSFANRMAKSVKRDIPIPLLQYAAFLNPDCIQYGIKTSDLKNVLKDEANYVSQYCELIDFFANDDITANNIQIYQECDLTKKYPSMLQQQQQQQQQQFIDKDETKKKGIIFGSFAIVIILILIALFI